MKSYKGAVGFVLCVDDGDVRAVSRECDQPGVGDVVAAFDFGRVLVPRHAPRFGNEGRGVAVKEAQNVVTRRLDGERIFDLGEERAWQRNVVSLPFRTMSLRRL